MHVHFKIIEFGLGLGDCKGLGMIALIVGHHKSDIHMVFVCSTVAASSKNTWVLSRTLESLKKPPQTNLFVCANVCVYTNISQ